MEREIKFRAWSRENKIMVTCNQVPVGMLNKYDDPVMQFTGLLDKNGKEIFEGDIIKNKWGHNVEVKIEEITHSDWEDSFAGFGFGMPTHDIEDYKKEIEIIGNIYENPELIK